MDPTSATERLSAEFEGIFSPESVAEVLHHSALAWEDAPVQTHVPVLAERFARERLRAVAQAGGQIVKEVPEVLFVCVHNAGRSQMAAALLDHHAGGRITSARPEARRPRRSTRPPSRPWTRSASTCRRSFPSR